MSGWGPWSLRARLIGMIAIVVAVVLVPLGWYSYQRTVAELTELSDGRLAETARTLDAVFRETPQPSPGAIAVQAIPSREIDLQSSGKHKTYEAEVGFQILDRAGRLQLSTQNLAHLIQPLPAVEGYQDLHFNAYRWRIFNLPRAAGGWIRVAERYDSRYSIAHALWLDHTMRWLIGLPLLMLLVSWAVKRGLRPLQQLTLSLQQRKPGSREPIGHGPLPLELRPVTEALNDLLQRLDGALERERHFNADLAHELRTPLAATTLHLENAMLADSADQAAHSMHSAHQALAALTRRIEQLLALARLESGVAAMPKTPVSLTAVAKNVLDEFGPLLLERDLEVSFLHSGPEMMVLGYEAAINALIRNLVENAMRHTPPGGQVQLQLSADTEEQRVEVIDTGPGIPASLREQLFQRFQRIPGQTHDGLGLGLSLVQRAAQLHGARVSLLDPASGQGLRVQVAFALDGASAGLRNQSTTTARAVSTPVISVDENT